MSGTAKHYISLFTGAGGLDIGFNEAGFHGLLASDIMPQAKETFILNYGKSKENQKSHTA